MPTLQWAVVDAELDPVQGSEQHGRRPVLIVSNEGFNQAMPNVTVLPLTSAQRRLYPAEVLLRGGIAGQPRDSIVLAHQVRTISKLRLRTMYGYLHDVSMRRAVQEALKLHLELD